MRLLVAALGVVVAAVLSAACPASASAGPDSRAAAGPPSVPADPVSSSSGPTPPAELPGVPAAALLARGRVLVLRPHRLEIAVDGRVRREVALTQPLDLSLLPDVVGDPAFADRIAPGVLRLGAVLVQRPDTRVEAGGPLRVELGDTGGAGPARLTGTRSSLRLRGVTVSAVAGSRPSPPFVAAGLRYLHESDVRLEDVTLAGLGGPRVPALRADGGRLALVRVALSAAGRGVQVGQPVALDVDGLAGRAAGTALTLIGGRQLVLCGLRLVGTSDALVVRGSVAVVVRGGELRGGRHAVRATDSRDVVLEGTATTGAVRGATVRSGPAGPPAGGGGVPADGGPGTRPPWWPVRGAGALALLVLAGGIALEPARSRRRSPASIPVGVPDRAARWAVPGALPVPADGDLLERLDLGLLEPLDLGLPPSPSGSGCRECGQGDRTSG
ncbi:MAG TPA: hypothetical protein VMT69_07680 [Kineosporiaceae bacterium]|nr:hypothetical protein [Kineosporiaceae bacterium]